VTEPGVEPTSSGCTTGDCTTDLKRSAVMSGTGIHRLIYRDICEAATAHNINPSWFRCVLVHSRGRLSDRPSASLDWRRDRTLLGLRAIDYRIVLVVSPTLLCPLECASLPWDAAAGGLTTGWWAIVLECFSSHPLRVNPAWFRCVLVYSRGRLSHRPCAPLDWRRGRTLLGLTLRVVVCVFVLCVCVWPVSLLAAVGVLFLFLSCVVWCCLCVVCSCT